MFAQSTKKGDTKKQMCQVKSRGEQRYEKKTTSIQKHLYSCFNLNRGVFFNYFQIPLFIFMITIEYIIINI